MFAVPGWSLSSALLKTQDASTSGDGGGDQVKKPRKRKRKHGDNDHVEVNSSNVADLLRQHVEQIAGIPNDTENPSKPKAQDLGRHTKKTDKERHKSSASRGPDPSSTRNVDNKHVSNQQKIPEPSSTSRATYQSEEAGNDALSNKASQPIPPKTLEPVSKALNSENLAPRLTPLQAAMRQKLISARFRHLNQTLYTAPSIQTQKLFDMNPTFFDEYHEGFRQQVSTWPDNPVDTFVLELLQRGQVKDSRKDKRRPGSSTNGTTIDKAIVALPRTGRTCTVADLGCGDAALASRIVKSGKKLKINVLSYDLQSPNSLVTKADISNLPCEDGSVDVAIFCLALMGTNWTEFIDEAWRILRWKGELWIAEIKSRFARPADKRVDHSVGKRRKVNQKSHQKGGEEDDDVHQRLMVEVDGADNIKQQTDVSAFVAVLQKRGFVLHGESAVDMSNKMFVRLKFLKASNPVKGKNLRQPLAATEKPGMKRQRTQFIDKENDDNEIDEATVLRPCLYKVR